MEDVNGNQSGVRLDLITGVIPENIVNTVPETVKIDDNTTVGYKTELNEITKDQTKDQKLGKLLE